MIPTHQQNGVCCCMNGHRDAFCIGLHAKSVREQVIF